MIILGYLAIAYVLWVMFLAVMSLANTWDHLPMFVKVMAIPAVLVAVTIDIMFNIISTVIFFDPPREAMFTQRMSRYKKTPGIRCKIATAICNNLLDPFQNGGHCRD